MLVLGIISIYSSGEIDFSFFFFFIMRMIDVIADTADIVDVAGGSLAGGEDKLSW